MGELLGAQPVLTVEDDVDRSRFRDRQGKAGNGYAAKYSLPKWNTLPRTPKSAILSDAVPWIPSSVNGRAAGFQERRRMVLEYGKLERPFLDPGADLHGAWGTLGEPVGPAGGATLLHLFRTRTVTLRHAFYAPEAQVAPHVHAVPSFVYGDGGPCCEISRSIGESKRRLTFHPAGYRHELRYEGPTNVLAVEVTGEVGELPKTSVGLPATLYGEIWNILTAVALQEPSSRIDQAVSALAAQTIAVAQTPHPRWLTNVLDQVHARWDTPPSARALAAASGVSINHLCRAFKRWMGVTTRQYGLLIRLDRARHQLWSTDAPLSQVATDSGFTDQSHLCRALASWHATHRPGGLRAIRPTRLEAHNHSVTEAGMRMTTARFVGKLPSMR